MTTTAAWPEKAFADLLAQPGTFLAMPCARSGPETSGEAGKTETLVAFALGRVILDEAELLTLAVDPRLRRAGLGRSCLAGFEAEARARGAARAFLEVAEDNAPARALYGTGGWAETGLRRAYYRTENGRIDAVLMSKSLPA